MPLNDQHTGGMFLAVRGLVCLLDGLVKALMEARLGAGCCWPDVTLGRGEPIVRGRTALRECKSTGEKEAHLYTAKGDKPAECNV